MGEMSLDDKVYRSESMINDLLTLAVRCSASDLHLTVGVPPILRYHGKLMKISDMRNVGDQDVMAEVETVLAYWPELKISLTPEILDSIARDIVREETHLKVLEERGSVDLALSVPGVSRFRVNVYKQRGNYAVAFRMLSTKIPRLEDSFSHAPIVVDVLHRLADLPRGLILVTGPTGSGKSTTLAAMIDYINKTSGRHIITLEDPIEYMHKHERCIINQREIGADVISYADGLRAALREDPDVILVGEMRDLETVSIAITAAETGHLVMSTLHTNSAAETVERIIDVFPPSQQQQIRIQLAGVLQGVISQQLLPRKDKKGRVCAVEIMIVNNAIKALIREGKVHMIPGVIQTGMNVGMIPMDKSLANLVLLGLVDEIDAEDHAIDQKLFKSYLGGNGMGFK